ncbi:MAG: hypothetical protein AAGF26_07460 [Cyanobacteria bacterium P01_G01_bin.49]
MENQWTNTKGIVTKGHQVASGMAINSPYPRGSIAMQTPFFRQLGLDISTFFPGTLNIALHPYQFKLNKPEYTFAQVKWNANFPPETFSFSACRLTFRTIQYDSLIYYPHPETKPAHFQDNSTLELLAPVVPNIDYGDEVFLEINPQEISIFLD